MITVLRSKTRNEALVIHNYAAWWPHDHDTGSSTVAENWNVPGHYETLSETFAAELAKVRGLRLVLGEDLSTRKRHVYLYDNGTLHYVVSVPFGLAVRTEPTFGFFDDDRRDFWPEPVPMVGV